MIRALFTHFLRSFRNRKSWMALYLSSSVFGVTGLFLLFTLKAGIDGSLQERSQYFLTADISVSARRLFTEEEKSTITRLIAPYIKDSSQALDLLSMIRVSADRSRLVDLSGVEPSYPLHGKILLEGGAPASRLRGNEIVIDSDLRDQLALKIGDTVRVGDLDWKVAGVISEDTSSVWKGLSIAPSAFVSRDFLAKSSLIKTGSTLTERFFYRLKRPDDADDVARMIRESSQDSGIRVTTYKSSNEQLTRTMDYLADYLGLLATISFLMAFVGTLYLVQTERARVRFEMALLRTLGLKPRSVLSLIWIESAGLSLLMTMISWLLVRVMSVPIFGWIAHQMGVKIQAQISGGIFLAAFAFSFFTYGVSMYLLLRRELNFPLSSLLSGSSGRSELSKPRWWDVLAGALFIFALAIGVSHSYRLGIAFTAALLVAGGFFALVFAAICRALPVGLNERGAFQILALHLTRNRLSQGIAFGTLSFGALLLFLIPGLSVNFRDELRAPDTEGMPSLFLFDIQPEQVEGIRNFLKGTPHRFESLSPMIRARLEKVNGKPVEPPKGSDSQFKSREEQEEERTRNRGYNLTYRSELFGSEKIVRGRHTKPLYDSSRGELPEITVEKKFAERLGVGLGDTLEFDVQSVPITGKIVGVRSIRWTSFQPNFFVQFQPGVLEEAPKTFLATVESASADTELATLQSKLIDPFPNVSVISVRTMISKITGVFAQMELAIQLSAAFVLFSGLLVFFSIIRLQAADRVSEIQLLKVLGGSIRQVRAIVLGEALFIGLVAVLLGCLLSVVFTEVIVQVAFSRSAIVPVGQLAIFGLGAFSALSLVSGIAFGAALSRRPSQLLDSSSGQV